MRIASLVPSATEICFALGLGDRVVAVTHECDHPPAAVRLPELTRSVIEPGLSPPEIDAAVLELTGRGEPLYALDEPALAGLDVDLLITQQLCEVCAVSYEEVRAVAARLPSRPEVLSLDPSRLDDVLTDIVTVARASSHPERGERLRDELSIRIDAVRSSTAAAPAPRVVALEWLDPPYAAGHWLPEMIAAAGGEDVLAGPGERSREVGSEEIAHAAPETVVVMPCGLDRDQAASECGRHLDELRDLGASAIHAVDAKASFSRPGPRLADGVELLGHLLHPDLVAAPIGLPAAVSPADPA